MCGICGIVRQGGTEPVPVEVLRRMSDTMVHRGPDEDGFAAFPGGGFGFRRLSIIDPAGSHQPIANEDGRLRVVCNGEIYNYRELREELLGRGHRFATAGDVETVVHAYEEWGTDCLRRLRGMFGLALWDEAEQRLILARDRLGIKPLHYAVRGKELVFGSTLNAVLAAPGVSRDIDWAAIDLYLSLMYVPSPLTAFAGVRKLEPGCYLVYDRQGLRRESYWRPPRELEDVDEQEAVAEFERRLENAVALHLRSDVPVGFFLSGGMDSSALVALAARVGNRPPTTFSVGFGTPTHDELAYARQVAEAFGCEHHELMVRPDAASVLPRAVTQCGEPFGDSSIVPTAAICRAAAGAVKVVVGGDGGDELLAGYEWTSRQRLIERWARLPRLLRRPLETAVRPFRASVTVAGKLSRFVHDAGCSPLQGYCRRIGCMGEADKRVVYGPALADRVSADAVAERIAPFFDDGDPVASMNRADLGLYLPGDDLCKVDCATMMHSLEGRVPLVDHEVVEFALSLPMHLKLRGTTSKYILKKAMRGTLPSPILRQRKQGFAVPVDAWMRGELRRPAERILSSSRAAERGVIRSEGVRDMLQAHACGRARNGHKLWTLLVLELWFRLCIDGDGTAPDSLDDLD
jgi:asparagine synthase (glutamine-hydrolysing)